MKLMCEELCNHIKSGACDCFGEKHPILRDCDKFKREHLNDFKCPFCGAKLKNLDAVAFTLEKLDKSVICEVCWKRTLGVNWITEHSSLRWSKNESERND